MRRVFSALADYFQGFDERASGARENDGRDDREDASSGFCFAALLAALGYMISSAASASAAAPF